MEHVWWNSSWRQISSSRSLYELSHEIMILFVICKLILQTRMRSHLVRLDVWFLVGHFVYLHTSCIRTAKALARLRGCAGSPEPSLVAYVISTIISYLYYRFRMQYNNKILFSLSQQLDFNLEPRKLIKSQFPGVEISKINGSLMFLLWLFNVSWPQRNHKIFAK